jgi:hypothetical protein
VQATFYRYDAATNRVVDADGDAEFVRITDDHGRLIALLYRLIDEPDAEQLRLRVTRVLTALAEPSSK